MDIELSIEVSKEIGDLDFGVELGGDGIEEGGFFARISDQPIGIPLRRLLEKCGGSPELEILNEKSKIFSLYRSFDLWLIPHDVSIMRRKGLAEPTSVGIEVQYKNEDRTCSIISLLPSCRFVEHGGIRGSLTLSGEAGRRVSPADDVALTQEFFGLHLGLTSRTELTLEFAATVVTPYIAAVGENASRCEWRFDKHTEPLFGQNIRTWAVVALPKRQRKLNYDARFYFDARTFFFPHRYECTWVSIECPLEG